MIRLFVMVILLLPLSALSGSIYKCKDNAGKVTFSDKPCLTKKGSQEQISKDEEAVEQEDNLDNASKHDQVSSFILDSYSSKDIVSYLESLKFDKFSEVLPGIQKNRFHGVDIEKLFKEKDIMEKKWFQIDESLEYLIHVENTFKLFSVSKTVYNREENSHNFLNLTDREIISTLSLRGFGKPKDRFNEANYSWKWDLGDIKCELVYRRNRFNPEKGFKYSCKKKEGY